MRCPPRNMRFIDRGTEPYEATWALQKELLEARILGDVPDSVILVEHPPVITLGRRLKDPAAVLDAGDVPVLEVERGGEATVHGPGQLVVYPIVGVRDVHAHLRRLEEVVIRMLADWGLQGGRNPPHTGVWVQDKKVASIGVAVRRWVAYHGMALNLQVDPRLFGRIIPCGLSASVMASVSDFLPQPIAMEEAKVAFRHHWLGMAESESLSAVLRGNGI